MKIRAKRKLLPNFFVLTQGPDVASFAIPGVSGAPN